MTNRLETFGFETFETFGVETNRLETFGMEAIGLHSEPD